MLTPTVLPVSTVASLVPTSPVVTVPQRSSSDPAEVSDSRTLADAHPTDTPDTAPMPVSVDPTVVTTLLSAADSPSPDSVEEDPSPSVEDHPLVEDHPSVRENPTDTKLPRSLTEDNGEHCDLDIAALKRHMLRNNCVQYSL